MKDINPKTILAIILAIAIIASVAAYYGSRTLAVSECNHYFNAQDGDGNAMPFMTHFDFYEWKDGEWVTGGRYHMPTNTIGSTLWLRSDTRYKAIPEEYEGWKTPPTQTFYGCVKDCTFVYERIVCTPGVKECEGDTLYECNSDGTEMRFKQTCVYGCTGGACNDPPAAPCSGLSECSSTTGWFQECCDGKIWACTWCNYDGSGYRFQWDLTDTCDVDCVCDGSETEQKCWCEDLTPDCSGLGTCSHEVYLCDACCGNNIWECRGHYKWELKDFCASSETCECTGSECLDCNCVTIATPTPTPGPIPTPTATPTPDTEEEDEDDHTIWIIGGAFILVLWTIVRSRMAKG